MKKTLLIAVVALLSLSVNAQKVVGKECWYKSLTNNVYLRNVDFVMSPGTTLTDKYWKTNVPTLPGSLATGQVGVLFGNMGGADCFTIKAIVQYSVGDKIVTKTVSRVFTDLNTQVCNWYPETGWADGYTYMPCTYVEQ